jgi:gliding motility-associated-like protein
MWVNGNFEDTTMACYRFNPANKYANKNAPWLGYTVFRWQPLTTVQPSYLNEATKDHTKGTNQGYYLYLDPRAQSGYKYQFSQSFKVKKSTWYNFSMWYCSMNKPGNPGATIRLTVNNTVVASDVTIANNNDVWTQIKGSWFSGFDTTAIAAMETLGAQVHGHDFAIDDIIFGTGSLIADAGPDLAVCDLNNVQLSGNTAAQLGSLCRNFSYEWQPAANISGNNKTLSVTLKSPATPGDYFLTVTDLNGNMCIDAMKLSSNKPPAPTDFRDTSICEGQQLEILIPGGLPPFTWEDGSTVNPRTLTQSGLYFIQFSNPCGIARDSILLTIDSLPEPDLGPDTTICNNSSFTASVKPVYSNIQWDNGSNSITRTVNSNAKIWVKVWNKCTSYNDTLSVRYLSLPKNLVGNDTTFCDSVIYKATLPSQWPGAKWWDGDTSSPRLLKDTGTFRVSYRNYCGVLNDSIRLVLSRIPPINIGPDTSICMNGNFSISAPSGFQYIWNTGSVSSSIPISSPGIYSVLISNTDNCTASDTVQITSKSNLSKIFMPNAFTPDDNALNDRYPFNQFPQNVEFRIYNRFGQKVFQSNGKNTWDGIYQSQPAQEGIYAWILIYMDCSGFRKVESGNFTLLR